MNLDLMPISPQDAAQVWRNFPGSPFQAVMHNEIMKGIQDDRSTLETCEQDRVIFLQARLAARRDLLGFIHRNDSAHRPN